MIFRQGGGAPATGALEALPDSPGTHPDDQDLARLRADFDGYRIWRAVRRDGLLGEWVATLHNPRAGVDPTVMCPTADTLRAALVEEAERARRGRDRDRTPVSE
ncbi:hypothetical protein [Actinomadura vinacea]|uniref:hypothetical protein n=1 Tax=Actinomadura vinacea TaxID=115336 RepID=UPI0031D75314